MTRMPVLPGRSGGAIEGGDSSEIEKYIELCTECERIAIQIHPSYEKQYKDVSAMMRMPPQLLISRSQPNISS